MSLPNDRWAAFLHELPAPSAQQVSATAAPQEQRPARLARSTSLAPPRS